MVSGWSTLRLTSSRRNYPTTLYLDDVPVMTALVLAPDQGATVTLTAGTSREFGLGPNARPSTVSGVEYSFVDATPNYILYRRTNDSVLVSGLSSLTSMHGASLMSPLRSEGSSGSNSGASNDPSSPGRPGNVSSSNSAIHSGAGIVAASDTPKLSGGAIAGIAVGGVAGLLLVIFGAFCLLRRRKKASLSNEGGNPSSRVPEVDGLSSERRELPAGDHPRELAMHETETQELKGDAPQNELRADLAPTVYDQANTGTTPQTILGAAERSLHVHAQKKREVEWLEAEEARLRQRRERLTSQDALRL